MHRPSSGPPGAGSSPRAELARWSRAVVPSALARRAVVPSALARLAVLLTGLARRAVLLAGLAGLAAVGCGGEDDRPATWAYISPAIVQPNCATAGCHSRLSKVNDVRLDSEAAGWVSLLGADGAGNYVAPGDPDASLLLFLLRGDGELRMPPDQPLPDADIALIERWIQAGAPRE